MLGPNHDAVYEKGITRQARLDMLTPYGDVSIHDQWNKHKICFEIFYPDLGGTEKL